MSEHYSNVRGIALGYILMKSIVYLFASWNIVNVWLYSQAILVLLQKLSKRFIPVRILPKIKIVHSPQIFSLHIVIVGQKIEVVRCLP